MLSNIATMVYATETPSGLSYAVDTKAKETIDTTVSATTYRDVVAALERDGWTIDRIIKDGDNRIIKAYRYTKNDRPMEENFRFDLSDGKYSIVRFCEERQYEQILVAAYDNEGKQQDVQVWNGSYTHDSNATLRFDNQDGSYATLTKQRSGNEIKVLVVHYDANGTNTSTESYAGKLMVYNK